MGINNNKFIQIIGLLVVAALLSACGSTNTTSLTQTTASSRIRSLQPSTSSAGCDFPCVPVAATNEQTFQTAIYGLLDAINISDLGEVRLTNGASLGLEVELGTPSASGVQLVIPQLTRMQLVIRDYKNGQPMQPIQITLDGGNSAENVDVYGELIGDNLEVGFIDDYGQIVIVGQIVGETIQGTINYQNFVSNTGATGKSSSGVLMFQMPLCQAIACQSGADF